MRTQALTDVRCSSAEPAKYKDDQEQDYGDGGRKAKRSFGRPADRQEDAPTCQEEDHADVRLG